MDNDNSNAEGGVCLSVIDPEAVAERERQRKEREAIVANFAKALRDAIGINEIMIVASGPGELIISHEDEFGDDVPQELGELRIMRRLSDTCAELLRYKEINFAR